MQRQTNFTWMLVILILAWFSHAVAEHPEGTIQLQMMAEKEVVVVNSDGESETQRVPAANVVPDDKVMYTITYRNTGEEDAEQVQIVNPVPVHMHYLEGTASGDHAMVTFSVDGGKVFAVPEELSITVADGTSRRATAQEYTHIRWTLENNIATGGSGEVSFWAQLD